VPTSLTFDRKKQRALPLWLVIVTALLIIARVVSTKYPANGDVDLVHWTPLHFASAMATRSHRPILYEFSADWCGPCHLLDRDVFMDSALAGEINDRYIAVKVIDRQREEGSNAPEVQQLMQRYAVNGFPTIVIVGTDGRVRDKVLGYTGRDKMAALLDREP
jgi:thiol:disulfide interchange protein